MQIRIHFIKLLDIKKVASGSFIDIKDGCTVKELLEYLEIKKYPLNSISVLVNDAPSWSATVLNEGDHIKIFVSLGGG